MKGRSVCRALLCAYIITILLLLLLAFLLFRFDIGEKLVHGGITFIYLVSSFVGGLLMGKSVGRQKYLWGAVIGVGYFLILTGISLFTGNGSSHNLMDMVTAFALCLGGGMMGGMLA